MLSRSLSIPVDVDLPLFYLEYVHLIFSNIIIMRGLVSRVNQYPHHMVEWKQRVMRSTRVNLFLVNFVAGDTVGISESLHYF